MLNQLPYEPVTGPYDIVEPFEALYRESPLLNRVRNVYRDMADIPEATCYDRITSVAVFEHLPDLPKVTERAARLLAEGGSLRVAIPNEGTLLWRLGTAFTGLEFNRMYGLDYQVLMKYEHLNTAAEIEAVLRHHFGSVEVRIFGISRSLGFYRFLCCREPRLLQAS